MSDSNIIEFPKRESSNPFENLSQKLDVRFNKIETDLKDSLAVLESDIQKLVRKNKDHSVERELRDDVDRLSKMLEQRIKQALQNVTESIAKDKASRSELRWLSSVTDQLSSLLSFDFLKSLLGRLPKDETAGDVDEFGMDPIIVEKIKPFFDFLYFKYWRVKTTGIKNVPNDGKALIVANHSGTLPYDGSMLAAAIYNEHPVRHDARFLVENFVYHMPVLGSLMYRIGGVRACPENAERLLETDHLVIVFPEGVKGIGKYFSDRYKLQRFGRGGFIKLCLKTSSPLIPTGIVGAEEIHPILFKSNTLAKAIGLPYIPITPTFPLMGLLGLIPFPSKWAIHFGKPILFKESDKAILDDEIQVHRLSETVRGEIQDILIELLKKRGSVVWG